MPCRLPGSAWEVSGREVWLASSVFPPLAFSPLCPSPSHDVTPASFRVRGGEGGERKGQRGCWWCPLGGCEMPRCCLFLLRGARHWRRPLRAQHALTRATCLRWALCAPPLCPAGGGACSGPEWPPHMCTPVSSRELGHASLKPSCQT